MKMMLVVLMLCLSLAMTVQAEQRVICWRNAVTGEREPFDPYMSAEKMREFVYPHDTETLSVYDGYIDQGFFPLESYKSVMDYNAQKQRDKARMSREP